VGAFSLAPQEVGSYPQMTQIATDIFMYSAHLLNLWLVARRAANTLRRARRLLFAAPFLAVSPSVASLLGDLQFCFH
jgi:hypothetical protein